jgi:hypothetical protein
MSNEQFEHLTKVKSSASSAMPLQSGQRTFIAEFGCQKYNKVIQILARFGNRFINQEVAILFMDSTLRPVLKRQLLVIGASLGTGLLFTYFFGFFIGLAVNLAVMVGVIFYIRRKQLGALRSLGFSDEMGGGRYGNTGVKLKYICLSCGAEVKGARCGSCGSNMKKPLF